MARFPDNKQFAFTVFDDTDLSTVDNVKPVYHLLLDLGILTTKSVWSLPSVPGAPIGGETLQDRHYLDFVRWLRHEGFEIGLHSVRNHDANRDDTQYGFEEFHRLIGQYPRTFAGHLTNRENLYWGADRFNRITLRLGYNLATRFVRHNHFKGHCKDSPHFWGDICQQHLSYTRNFVFNEINLDRINPTLPYHDPTKPFVNFWFSSSEGGDVKSFCQMIAEPNQDRLEAEGGICIMYTHFAKGFCEDGVLYTEFERLMRRLAKKNGWCVPVATLLDYLRQGQTQSIIPSKELMRMERKWLLTKLRHGTS